MDAENTEAHELALTIINDGGGYARRCEIARNAMKHETGRGWVAQAAARDWLSVAIDGAMKYERQFGSYGASCFTPAAILCAAAELSEYYAKHVTEG